MANPWDRQEGEKDNEFAAFEIYLYLEAPDDAVIAAYRVWSDHEDAKIASAHFRNWANKNDWTERRREFRDAKAKARAEGVLGGIAEHWRLHAKAWEEGHTHLIHLQNRLYARAIEIFNKKLEEGNYNMGHGVQMGKLFLDIQKHILELMRVAEAEKTYEDIPDAELDEALERALTKGADSIVEGAIASVEADGAEIPSDSTPARS